MLDAMKINDAIITTIGLIENPLPFSPKVLNNPATPIGIRVDLCLPFFLDPSLDIEFYYSVNG